MNAHRSWASFAMRLGSQRKVSRYSRLRLEALEERRLLSVNQEPSGVLDICGDDDSNNQDDQIVLVRNAGDPSKLDVIVNGNNQFSGAIADIPQINIFAGGGNDTVIVDSSNGLINVPRGIRYDGDAVCPPVEGPPFPAGQGFDTLRLIQNAGAAQTSSNYAVGPEIGSGKTIHNGPGGTQTVFFANLEPVVDLVPAVTHVVTATPENNAVNYAEGSVATRGLITIDNYESYEFSNKTSLTIVAGAGDDVVRLNNTSTPTALATLIVQAGDGNDTVVLATLPVPTSVDGGTGDDRVDGAAATVVLTLVGGDGNDTLIGGQVIDNLNGGSGDDLLIGNGGNNTYTGGAGFDTIGIRGTARNDTITVSQGDATTLTSAVGSSSRTDTFSEMEKVLVEAGGGRDIILVSQADALTAFDSLPIHVDGGDPAAGDRLGVTDAGLGDTVIQRLSGSADAGSFQVGTLAPISYEGIEFPQVNPLNDITGGTGTDGAGRLLVFKHDPFEVNNSLANATFLGSGKTINVDPVIDPGPFGIGGGEIPRVELLPGDVDWFRWVAAETGTLDLQVYFQRVGTLANGRPGLPGDGQLDIAAFNTSGVSIVSDTSNDSDGRVVIPVVRNQTYYLRVSGRGEAINVYNLTGINIAAPIPQLVDLQAGSDSGRSDTDNITRIPLSTFDIILDDDRIDEFTNLNLVPDSINNDAPDNDYGVEVFNNGVTIGFAAFTSGNRWVFTATAGDLIEGHNNFISAAVWIRDRSNPVQISRGDLSTPLQITLDTIAPAPPTIVIDPATTDTGVEGVPATFVDRVTSNTAPGFTGRAEADAIVRMWADGPPISNNTIDGSDVFQGLTVAVPLDGDEAFPNGQWNLSGRFDLNDPIVGFPFDGVRQITVTAEDVAGNESSRNEPTVLNIFIDTQGPQVTSVQIPGAGGFDLFDPKPTHTPTPLISALNIGIQDLPRRSNVDANFLYAALQAGVATNPGHYLLRGDYNGIIPIRTVQFLADPVVDGQPATGTIVLTFFEPLPDDRFTLTLSDSLVDPAGNALDGESNAQQPLENPTFPSGDKQPGGNFVARFTVDSRPEIGVWSAGSVYIDTNGNNAFDPRNEDFTNRDITYTLGFTSDDVFAGNFAYNPGDVADGFDKLAAYGKANGQFRFLVDTDNDGVPNHAVGDPAAVNGVPYAGRFDNNDTNGDEVGVFDGTRFFFDTNHDYKVDYSLASNLRGYPVVGDFDGDGFDDLATWADDKFTIDLAKGVRRGWDGVADATINFGFIGVRERPVAADMDRDGIDDLGLWVPDRSGATPQEGGEWYFLVSNDPAANRRVFNTVNTLNHPFTPVPFGKDLFAQFGDEFAIPVVGNFDPPLTGGTTAVTQTIGHTNPADALDINADGVVTPLDALVVINDLNFSGSRQMQAVTAGTRLAPPYLDANGDGFVTPMDALLIINRLNLASASSSSRAASSTADVAGQADGGQAASDASPAQNAVAAPAADDARAQVSGSAAPRVAELAAVPRSAFDQLTASVATAVPASASAGLAGDAGLAGLVFALMADDSEDDQADVDGQGWEALLPLLSRDVAAVLERKG